MSLEGAHVTPELKDVRTAFLQEKGAVPEYDDYAVSFTITRLLIRSLVCFYIIFLISMI